MAYSLFTFILLSWVLVMWLQITLRNMLATSIADGVELPPTYDALFRKWFVLAILIFIGRISIFYVMVAKPEL